MTNGDKIRQMDNGELFTFLVKIISLNTDSWSAKTLCTKYEDTGRCLKYDEDCDYCLQSWLREEVQEDE